MKQLLPILSIMKGFYSCRFFCSKGGRLFSMKTGAQPFASLVTAENVLSAITANPNSASTTNIKFLDGTWYMDKNRSGYDGFLKNRIPGSAFFDIDAVSDRENPLPHMLPSHGSFGDAISEMGLSNEDHIIIYTQLESFSAARIWWTLRTFGHEKVSILQGGLNAWRSAGGETISGSIIKPQKSNYVTKGKNSKLVAGKEEVLTVVMDGSKQIVDARSSLRFLGQAPEPRPGLPGGHIPGSLNLPFTNLLVDGDYTRFRSPEEIRDAFKAAGVVMGSHLITSCGSGVTAAVLAFGMHLLGKDINSVAVYDGSWTEWASIPELPRYNPSVDDK